jgi:hypothetical protein
MGPCGQAGGSKEFWFAARAEFERGEETREGNLGAHVPPHGGRLVMNRALIKGKRGLTQLGGPDELACDFERRSLRRDAGAGI